MNSINVSPTFKKFGKNIFITGFFFLLIIVMLNHWLSVPILCCILLAFLIYKLTENFLSGSTINNDGIMCCCIWFSILIWVRLTGRNEVSEPNMMLVCLCLALALKWLPTKLLVNDKYFIKRLAVSIVAGLAVFVILKITLLQTNMMILSGLFAAGTFFSYLFESQSDVDDIKKLLLSTSFLIATGALTLIATRLVGDIGLVVLSIACCRAPGKGLLAACFWGAKLLVQAFVLNNVANVTGINLMHPYCSAALFFGFLSILFLSLILKVNPLKSMLLAVFILTGLLLPPTIIYLVHEEAAASFLIASNVVAISLVSFAPLIYKEPNAIKQDNLILMPLFLSTIGLLFAPLIEIGNQATVASRLQIISYVTAALLVIYLILSNIKRAARNPV